MVDNEVTRLFQEHGKPTLVVRTLNVLDKLGVTTVAGLRSLSDREVLMQRNAGAKVLAEIRRLSADAPDVALVQFEDAYGATQESMEGLRAAAMKFRAERDRVERERDDALAKLRAAEAGAHRAKRATEILRKGFRLRPDCCRVTDAAEDACAQLRAAEERVEALRAALEDARQAEAEG